jgi:hypothetical protein
MQQRFVSAIGDARGVQAADRLCEACVGLLDVDAAAIRWSSMGPTWVRWALAIREHERMTNFNSSSVRGRAWIRWPAVGPFWSVISQNPTSTGGRSTAQ